MQLHRPTSAGFSLIELMITVAIVGILAAIAYPSYMDSVRKSWRANAASCLTELAQRMERRYTIASIPTYEFGDDDADDDITAEEFLSQGCAAEGEMPDRYTFDFTEVGTDAFTLRATPVNPGPQAADNCGALTLNELGQKGAGGDLDICWKR